MRTCTVCSWPPRTRNSVDQCLVGGMSYTDVAKKFNRANQPISRSAVQRHAKHVLTPSPEGHRPQGGAPGPAIQGLSLLERVEVLIKEHQGIAETAKGSGQLIAAVAALREIRVNLEMLGKLSGELSSQNINFFNIDLTENRIREFIDAAAERGPQVGKLLRDEGLKRFGQTTPNIQINFVPPPKLDGHGNLVLQALPAPSDAHGSS